MAKVILEGLEIRQEERDLLPWVAFGSAAEEQERGLPFLTECEKRSEIGVGRDDDAPFRAGTLDDLVVSRRLQAVVADMDCVVAGRSELVRHHHGERVVDEELQPAAASGSSRSRTASAA